jgi:hypothetical protein
MLLRLAAKTRFPCYGVLRGFLRSFFALQGLFSFVG